MRKVEWSSNGSQKRMFLGQLLPTDIALAKAILASWNSTDGKQWISNYGLNPGDIDPSAWYDRDGYALAGFTIWWNNTYPNKIPGPGSKNNISWQELTFAHLEALKKWAADKGLSIVPGQLPGQTWPSATPPPSWPSTLPYPPPVPDWWPQGFLWPPVGTSWGVPPLQKPTWWDQTGLNWPPPLPGTAGYSYPPFPWPPSLWPIPPLSAPAPLPNVPGPSVSPPPGPAPAPRAPRAPRVPGGTPTCDPKFHWDPTSGLCQPDLPPAKQLEKKAEGKESNIVLWVVGGLLALGVGVAILGGRRAAPAHRGNPHVGTKGGRTAYNLGYDDGMLDAEQGLAPVLKKADPGDDYAEGYVDGYTDVTKMRSTGR